MSTLDWIGKNAVVTHHRQVPYRLPHCDDKLSAGVPDAGNLLVQGDDLEALKALLQYLGRVLRPADGKEKARVYDYVDVQVDVLSAAAKARQKVYGRR